MLRDKSPSRNSYESDVWNCTQCIDTDAIPEDDLYFCCKCHAHMCQICFDYSANIGCIFSENKVCKLCFENVYKNKPVYCDDRDCDCDNKTPKQLAARRYKSEFNSLPLCGIDVEEWKHAHSPINYPGKYTGRYLVDIALSNDDFERGYIQWLIKEGKKSHDTSKYTLEQQENFQRYVQEAKELEKLLKRRRYSFRPRK